MIAEAIEKIREMSKVRTIEIGSETYIISPDGKYTQITPKTCFPDTLELHSLAALVQMVKTEALATTMQIFGVGTPIFIVVVSPVSIQCTTQPVAGLNNQRAVLYKVSATDVPGWKEDTTLPYEDAVIALRTRFEDTDDSEYLLRLISEISSGAAVTYRDNGIAASVVSKKGIDMQGKEDIRPYAMLRPYRTFHEVDQPTSVFNMRVSEKGIRLIEADGGIWKLDARRTIVEHLNAALADYVDDGQVLIMI